MSRAPLFLSLFAVACALAGPLSAATTGPAGGSAPIENRQPSTVLTQYVGSPGVFPSQNCPTCDAGNVLGMIHTFAGAYSPFGNQAAQGQLLSISQNTALFALYGTTWGGNGVTTFALPDLTGRVAVGQGQGPGLSSYDLGQTGGAAQTVMTLSQLAAHDHGLPGGGLTGLAGGGQLLDNVQPYLGMNYQIAVNGIFQCQDCGAGDAFIGQVSMFGGDFASPGYLPADGRLLSIADYDALWSIIGTTYGGDGQDTFALPDLRGRTPIGFGGGYDLGEITGNESFFLSEGNLPFHDHTLPGGGLTDPAGAGLPFSNLQPSLALNYLIAVNGLFPGQSGGGGLPFYNGEQILGEVVLSASGVVPKGWALAQGQLLSISQNTALFAILGTTYGGNGVTTFALPDLRGRAIMGAGAGFNVGDLFGEANHTLTIAEMAAHVHSVPDAGAIPEPGTWSLMIAGFGLAGAAIRRRRRAGAA